MSREEIFEKARAILAEKLMVDSDDITMETDVLNELCPDSLVIVEITMNLEDEFNIVISDGEMAEVSTVTQLVEFLEEKIRMSGM